MLNIKPYILTVLLVFSLLFFFQNLEQEHQNFLLQDTESSLLQHISKPPIFKTEQQLPERQEMPDWMVPDPRFHAYLRVTSKAILTIEEQQELRAMFESHTLIELAQSYLLAEAADAFDVKDERQRIISISYLEIVLAENYGDLLLEEGLILAEQLLTTNRVRTLQDSRLKQSLIGDKFKIGRILIEHQPKAWSAFKAKYQEPWIKKLVQAIEQDVLEDRL